MLKLWIKETATVLNAGGVRVRPAELERNLGSKTR